MISSFMSYGLLALSGTSVSSEWSMRSAGSLVGVTGGFSRFDGTKFMKRRSIDSASTSFSKARSATPDLVVCVTAPPSSSAVTSSCVTVFTTSGPVTNMYDCPSP